MGEAKYYVGIILVGIFISLPGWLLVFSVPILGVMLVIFSFILQQLIIKKAIRHKRNRLVKLNSRNLSDGWDELKP